MKKLLALILVLAVLPLSALMVSAGGYDCTVEVIVPEKITEGQSFEVQIRVGDMVEGKDSPLVCFILDFDADLVTPNYVQTIVNDTACIKECPGTWEQMVTLDTTENFYDCSFMPADTGRDAYGKPTADCLSYGDELIVSIPFIAKEGSAGKKAAFELIDVMVYDAEDETLSSYFDAETKNGETAIEAGALPVSTLGAKINTQYPSLRLGAFYDSTKLANLDLEISDVTDVGIVFCPARFVSGELTKETSGAVALSAVGIEEYDPDKKFSDYESFTFYVTIVAVPVKGYDTMIAFRGFFSTEDGDVYAVDTLERSYQYVLDKVFGPSVAGDDNISHEQGDNVIITPTNWWDD